MAEVSPLRRRMIEDMTMRLKGVASNRRTRALLSARMPKRALATFSGSNGLT
jgi:hypothetical protein